MFAATFVRLLLLLLFACSLVVLEGCATTQAVKTSKRKKKKVKKPKAIEGAPLAFDGSELDDEDGDDVEGAETDQDLTAVIVAEGSASFYHDSLAGRLTANGEKYNPNAATCAHRSLPFGTVVVVEDTATGKKAQCRINDRGPFVGGRIIDLSKRVARELGIIERGVARVRIRVIRVTS